MMWRKITVMDKFQLLVDSFGLEQILQQNDLEERDVVEFLYQAGKIDLDDYFGFEDVEVED